MAQLKRLQQEVDSWARHNFGPHAAEGHRSLLGMMEGLGKVSRGHLKIEQGIRTYEPHEKAREAGVGELVIYLADYCNAVGIDLERAVAEHWIAVRSRDWKRDRDHQHIEFPPADRAETER